MPKPLKESELAAEVVADAGVSFSDMTLRTADGKEVAISDLDLSANVKQLLRQMDLDGDGCVDAENVQEVSEVLDVINENFGSANHQLTHSELKNGLNLLVKLLHDKNKDHDELEYSHLPPRIQDVMKEWDTDGSGAVNVSELSAAAKAYKKIQDEGRLMKKIVVGLSIVIVLLLCGMFVLSYAAVDMAKEMRSRDDGVMQAAGGEVMKVASSAFDVLPDGTLVTRGTLTPTCPGNTTCRRLQSSSPILQVAQALQGKQLVSTLPDSVFKNLDMVTLSAEPHYMKLQVEGMKRIQMKTSKCGSVVELTTKEGVLTIDDTALIADAALAKSLDEAGMPHLLEVGGLFGRRLTRGFLEGFFTNLEDLEWECTSVELPKPADIPPSYNAKIQVRERVPDGAPVLSKFQNESGNMLLAGIEQESGAYYRTWTEEMLVFPTLQISAKHFPMHPLQTQLDIVRGNARAFMNQLENTGHHCRLGVSPVTLSLGALASQASGLRLVSLLQESGRILRHWRMEVEPQVDNEGMAVLGSALGLLETVTLDYLDVDTDPTESFQPGHPYRIRASSASGHYDVSVQYTELQAVPAMDLAGALSHFQVTSLSSACTMDEVEKTIDNPAALVLAKDIEALGVTPSPKVPRIEPFAEWPAVLKWHSDQFMAMLSAGEASISSMPPYWTNILFNADHQDRLSELHAAAAVGEIPQQLDFHGVSARIEVEQSSSSASLPGGLRSIKAVVTGEFKLKQFSMGVGEISREVEISEDDRTDGYAVACDTREMQPYLSVYSMPMWISACLIEEFDYIEFKFLAFPKSLPPLSSHVMASASRKLGMPNVGSGTRRLCSEDDCSNVPKMNLEMMSR